ncbi:UNVERIFIED_CONTAM: Adipolin [Trichonephila clavipes]
MYAVNSYFPIHLFSKTNISIRNWFKSNHGLTFVLQMPSEIEKDKKDFARLTWNLFQAGAQLNERKTRKRLRAERRKNLKAGGPRTKALIGPAGPRGPIGPPGPPGANITKEEMFEEFRQMIIKLIQNEVVHLPNSKLASLESNITKIKMQNVLFEKELHTPKVMSAFMWELQDYIKVPKSSRIELDMFKESNRGGTLSRSMGSLKSVSGRFEAPRTGFYHFNARIHIYVPLRRKIPNELFTVSFCVSGNCEKKIMLQTVVGVGSAERMTVSTIGMLYLKAHEYVSIFVDNKSSNEINIFEGSQFSGYLLGA